MLYPAVPGGDRLKQRPLDLLPQGQRLPLGQPELIEQEEQRRQQDQCRSHRQHQLALKAVGPQVPLVLPHVSPGEESDAAQDNQPHHGEIHQWVPRIAGQGDEGRARRPHQVEPGVAEGGHRMKHRVPESPEQPHLRAEPQSQQQRPCPLQDQRHRQNEAGPANDAPTWGAEMDSCITHRSFSPIRRPASMEMAAAAGHHTHAANLNQHEDHRLAEAGPVQRRVLDYQSCHAGGGGGGEQRVEKGGALPVRVEMGRVSSSAPAKISSAKPIRMIRAGAMWFFLRMNTAIPLSVLSEAARGQQDHDNTDGPAGL